MADITSQNSSFVLNIPDVFAVPQILQGYATDDAFMTDEVDIAETMMGVDGIMSYGQLPFIVPQTISFQADSPSIPNTMELWVSANSQAQTPFAAASGTIFLPSLGKQYTFTNGVLKRFTPAPQGKKVLQPQKYQIHWNKWASVPLVGV